MKYYKNHIHTNICTKLKKKMVYWRWKKSKWKRKIHSCTSRYGLGETKRFGWWKVMNKYLKEAEEVSFEGDFGEAYDK